MNMDLPKYKSYGKLYDPETVTKGFREDMIHDDRTGKVKKPWTKED